MGDTTEVLEQETTSEETIEEPTAETPDVEEAPVGDIEVEVEGEKVTMSPDEFQRFYKDWSAEQGWQTKYHKKGKELNARARELEQKEKELSENRSLIDEYRKVKKAIDANPKAYQYLNQLINESEPQVAPAIQKQIEELKSRQEQDRVEREREKAVVKLSREFDDFDYDKLSEFSGEFDFRNQEDMLRFSHLAYRGFSADDIKAEARAEAVRKARQKKGSPATGKKEASPQKKPMSIDEAADYWKSRVASGEKII